MTGEQLANWIEESTSTVFFGGAGMSTESGIPDFRSARGLYTAQHDLPFPAEYMLSHSCLVEHPAEFFDFYRTYLIHPQVRPNAGHRALVALEQAGELSTIITQNIDILTACTRRRGPVRSLSCMGRCTATAAWIVGGTIHFR